MLYNGSFVLRFETIEIFKSSSFYEFQERETNFTKILMT
jgi:hypothetical protein